MTFLNLDNAQLRINGLKLIKLFESDEGFNNKLFMHYRNSFTTQLLKIVGALDIIGNPASLFSNVGTGVVEFFEKPMEGFVKGPLEGVKGLGMGVMSLAKGITVGIFNSVSRLTGSVAFGLATISMDNDYIQRRERRNMARPKNIISGIGKGTLSLGMGVVEAISGAFMNPIKGAMDEGVKGFCKGCFKGITGLITKPITGVLDFTSQVTEGVKNTAQIFDDKANELKQRKPRVFYGVDSYFKEYNSHDADYLKILNKFKDGKFNKDHFVQSLMFNQITDNPKTRQAIIITYEHVIIFTPSKSSLKDVFSISNLKHIQRTGEGINIHLTEYTQERVVQIQCGDDDIINTMVSIMTELRYAHYATQLLGM